MRVIELAKRIAGDQSGATAIEYGLIAAGISVAILATLGTVKTGLVNTFTAVANNLN